MRASAVEHRPGVHQGGRRVRPHHVLPGGIRSVAADVRAVQHRRPEVRRDIQNPLLYRAAHGNDHNAVSFGQSDGVVVRDEPGVFFTAEPPAQLLIHGLQAVTVWPISVRCKECVDSFHHFLVLSVFGGGAGIGRRLGVLTVFRIRCILF